MEIDHARHLAHRGVDILAGIAEFAQVAAEHLDRDLSADARHDVIQPVRDRLADVGLDAGDGRDLVANVGQHLLARSSERFVAPQVRDRNQAQGGRAPTSFVTLMLLHAHVDLGRVHSFGVFVEFRAARAARDRQHFGNLQQQHLGAFGQPLAFVEARPRLRLKADREGALVERRQELAPHPEQR